MACGPTGSSHEACVRAARVRLGVPVWLCRCHPLGVCGMFSNIRRAVHMSGVSPEFVCRATSCKRLCAMVHRWARSKSLRGTGGLQLRQEIASAVQRGGSGKYQRCAFARSL